MPGALSRRLPRRAIIPGRLTICILILGWGLSSTAFCGQTLGQSIGQAMGQTMGRAMGEAMLQMMDTMSLKNDAGAGFAAGSGSTPIPPPPPAVGETLDGRWIGKNGERLRIAGSQFELEAGPGRRAAGIVQTYDRFLALHSPQHNQTWYYEFALHQGRLALRDPQGQLFLFRREDAADTAVPSDRPMRPSAPTSASGG